MLAGNRLTDRLNTYWSALRHEDLLPDFAAFNLSAISDLWQHCVLFTVTPGADGRRGVNFYMMGDSMKQMYGGDISGQPLMPGMRHFQGAALMRRMDEMMASPALMLDEGHFVNDKGRMVKYRSCMLPFGRDGALTHVLAGVSWVEG